MSRTYGQFCPVAKAAEIFCERWNALIFRELSLGPKRFCILHRGVPLMSTSMLSRRLKELEAEGAIETCTLQGGARAYRLTEAGQEFIPMVQALGTWGQRWTRRQLRENEIDPGLLLFDMERTVRGDAFGSKQTVVQLEFTDRPDGQKIWWFVMDGTKAEVCVHDPGFEVDLWLTTTAPGMIHIWRGDITLDRALKDELLDAHGPRKLVAKLDQWLNRSPLTKIEPAHPNYAI